MRQLTNRKSWWRRWCMRGEHSAVAVPIVRDVIKAYFDKKLGPKPPGNQMETSVRVLSQLRPAPLPAQSKSASGR